jgi:hypothetical protein
MEKGSWSAASSSSDEMRMSPSLTVPLDRQKLDAGSPVLTPLPGGVLLTALSGTVEQGRECSW